MADDYGKETPTPAIPSVATAKPVDVLQALKEWVEVRQGVRGSGLDKAVTLRDLLNTGLATPDVVAALGVDKSVLPSVSATADPLVPPTPTSLSAAGAISTILLTWIFAKGYASLAHFEVWRSQTDALGDAVKIAQVQSPVYADVVGSGHTYYYWVCAVSDQNGLTGTSPYNAVAGTMGQTAMDPQEVQDAVNGGIDASGLLDQLTVKTDENGVVSGYGLASTPSENDPDAKTFAIFASRFLIAPPASSGLNTKSPFFVQTVPTTVNGVPVAPGVYMADAFIMNGVIKTAHIGELQVDDAKISDVSVYKLTAGQLQVGAFIQSSNFQSGQAGFNIDANGTAEFNNVVVRGTVFADAGAIGGNLIDSTGVQSANFNGTTAGWRIDSAGNVTFNNGSFRGEVHAESGTFAGELEAATGTFEGSLSAATGTFSGRISGGYLTTGGYTGFSWPPSGQYGCYLGPSGLLIGNANNGKYLEVTYDGQIYAPGFSVVNGTLTISQANVIHTLNIAGNAVSVSAAYSGEGTFYMSAPYGGTLTIVAQCNQGYQKGVAGYVRVNGTRYITLYGGSVGTGSTGGDGDYATSAWVGITSMVTIAVGGGTLSIQVEGTTAYVSAFLLSR